MLKTLGTGLLFGALLLSGCAAESDEPETNEQNVEQQDANDALIDDLLAEHEENSEYASGEDQHIAYTQQELIKNIDTNYFKDEALFNRDTYAYELRVSDVMQSRIEQNGLKATYLLELSEHGRELSAFVQETSYDPDLNIGIVDPNDDTRDYLFLIRDGAVIESIFDDIDMPD